MEREERGERRGKRKTKREKKEGDDSQLNCNHTLRLSVLLKEKVFSSEERNQSSVYISSRTLRNI